MMTTHIAANLVEVASFGAFRLCSAEKWLEKDGQRVEIGSRALDILIVLVERAGESVSNRELMARVWRDVIVEDSSVRVNVASLRRVLGDGIDGVRYIMNIPGQGYCFVGLVALTFHHVLSDAGKGARIEATYGLPNRLQRMVGRDEQVQALTALVLSHRFVSIVGAGGIGKTTTAIATAHALLHSFDGDVCFFDLAVLASSDVLGATMAATLGLMVTSGDPVAGLLAWLRNKRILLVLDNCEHLIEAIASLAERLFQAAPHVHLLATSREPLRAEGEYAYRLPPLPSPPESPALSAAEAMGFPAVQLFVDRATANGNDFTLCDNDVPVIAEICRKLDGIALAIELGASRVAAFGVRGTADLLDNRFRLTWYGRRTALPRHQTLSAMLDWSYNLLPEREQVVLRRVSTFVGHFSLEAARRIAGESDADRVRIVDAINGLVAKSLAVVEAGQPALRYRLLESARVYAAEKLVMHGEADHIASRHTRYLIAYFEGRHADFLAVPAADATSPAIDGLGNIRACLEWSFSPHGDDVMGVRLCAAITPFLLELSLLVECRRWSEKALDTLRGHGANPCQEMALQEALAISSMFSIGNSSAVLTAVERGLQLAVDSGNSLHELRLLACMNIFQTRVGNLTGALDVAARSMAVAEVLDNPAALGMAEWMLGVAYHLIGNQARAQRHCESGLLLVGNVPGLNTLSFGYDHRIRALVVLARTLWLRGYADQAVVMAWRVINDGEQLGHPISFCIALIYATPVFMWTGNWDIADDMIERLLVHADMHKLAPYHAVGKGLKGELLVKRGEAARGIELLQECLNALRLHHHQVVNMVHMCALAEGFLAAGRCSEALSTIRVAVSMGQDIFNAPEVLRLQGEVLASMTDPDPALAEDSLRQALDCARRQSAPGWELRIVTTLAGLLSDGGRTVEARGLLGEILSRFTEGFHTIDYARARHLLGRLEHA